MVKKINEKDYKALSTDGVKVIDFSATWCGPCQMLAPVLEEISEEYAGKVDFYNIDTDDNPNIAQEFKITSIPAVAVVKNGQCVDMNIGFVPKQNLVEFIEKNL